MVNYSKELRYVASDVASIQQNVEMRKCIKMKALKNLYKYTDELMANLENEKLISQRKRENYMYTLDSIQFSIRESISAIRRKRFSRSIVCLFGLVNLGWIGHQVYGLIKTKRGI